MPSTTAAIAEYVVRELAPSAHEPDEAAITIVCEPFSQPPGAAAGAAWSLRLKAGTTLEEARTIASTLQARVKGLCHLERSDIAPP